MKYALIVEGKQVNYSTGDEANPEGGKFIVVTEPEGWVEATSRRYYARETLPKDVKLFSSITAAGKFAKRWKGHPWWCQPNGNYEAFKVAPVTETITVGYKRSR